MKVYLDHYPYPITGKEVFLNHSPGVLPLLSLIYIAAKP